LGIRIKFWEDKWYGEAPLFLEGDTPSGGNKE